LKARAIVVEKAECPPVHDGAGYLRTDIHEHYSSPLVWV
jgi:hypothetical protein